MVVQFDTNAIFANRQQNIHLGHMGSAIRRIGTGLRINSAADDPAGHGVSQHMQAQIRGIDMAQRNAQEGISLLQVAEAGASEIASMVQRIREILVQAANDMLTENERRMQQEEVNQLTHSIGQVSSFTSFNTMPLLTGMMGHPRPLLPETSRPIQNFPQMVASSVDSISQANSIMPTSTPPIIPANNAINLATLSEGQVGVNNNWNFTNGTLFITGNDVFQINGDVANYLDIRIEVQNDATIVLNNVRIDTSRGDAMDIGEHNVNLWLEGNSVLRTNSNNIHGLSGEAGGAGIAISSGTLVIDGPGSLRAEASQDGISSAFAGIGSGRVALQATNAFDPNPPRFTGTVTIAGGNVTAIGGSLSNGTAGGAGIGGGSNVATGSGANTPQLNVTNGTLNAVGGTGAAGIGAGSSTGSGINVHVTGGRVNAYGGAELLGPGVFAGHGGAGIGTGARSTGNNNGGSLTVDGGIVNVTGGARAAAVGGAGPSTLNNEGANVRVTGGLLEVFRGWIGGSNTTVNQGQTIVTGGNLSIHYATGTVGGVNAPYYYIDRSNVAAIDDNDDPTGEPAFRVQIFLNDTNHVFSQHGEYTFSIGGRNITATADSLGRLFFYLPEDAYGSIDGAGHMLVGGVDYTGEFALYNPTSPDHRNNTLILTPDIVPPPPPPVDNDVFESPSRPHIVGRPMVFQVGPNSYNLMFQHIGALTLETLGLRDRQGNNTINVIDRGGFAISQMIGFMDDVHATVMAEVSHLGASQNRLFHISNQLENTHQAHSDTHDNIVGVDNAREMSRFARHGLLRQASTVMMAQSMQARHDSVRALLNVQTLDNNARFGQHPRDREAFDLSSNAVLG